MINFGVRSIHPNLFSGASMIQSTLSLLLDGRTKVIVLA